MFNFEEIIASKLPCEIYLKDEDEFYVGVILCANKDSVCIKSIGRMGKFECYRLLPRNAIAYIAQFTEYLTELGYVAHEDECDADHTFANNAAFFEYARDKHLFIVIEDGKGKDVLSGEIAAFGPGYLKLMSYDEIFDGPSSTTYFNLDNYFIIKWGGTVRTRKSKRG